MRRAKRGGEANNHNIQFSKLQEEYLKTRDQKHLNKMYKLCVEIASNYIRKYAKGKGLSLNIPELSHDSAVYAIEQYLKKPGFRIERISAYMHFGCVKSLFRDKERERREVSYEDLLLNGGLGHGFGAEPVAEPVPRRARGGQPADDRRQSVLIKQGLLFCDQNTGKDYEEIFV
jgi:hypothetical protein